MLRIMKGYDEYNTILLPPRQPGEKLPQEVTDSFNEQQRKKEAEDREKAEAAAAAQADKVAEEGGEGAAPPVISTVPPSTIGEGAKAGSDVGEGAKDGKEDGAVFQITFKVRESMRNFEGSIHCRCGSLQIVLSLSFSLSGQQASFVRFLTWDPLSPPSYLEHWWCWTSFLRRRSLARHALLYARTWGWARDVTKEIGGTNGQFLCFKRLPGRSMKMFDDGMFKILLSSQNRTQIHQSTCARARTV